MYKKKKKAKAETALSIDITDNIGTDSFFLCTKPVILNTVLETHTVSWVSRVVPVNLFERSACTAITACESHLHIH